MGDPSLKFVDFERYCPQCKHEKVNVTEEPCTTCLETGARKGTEKPELFKEKEN